MKDTKRRVLCPRVVYFRYTRNLIVKEHPGPVDDELRLFKFKLQV